MDSQEPATLSQVMAIRGVGSRILGEIDLLERMQLRRTCHAFESAVNESLEGLCELFWEDIADVVSMRGGLTRLLPRCPGLKALSLWPRTAQERPPDRWESLLHKAVPTPGITAHSLLALGHCKHLRSLNLAGCADVKDRVLAAIAASCRELERLDISDNNTVTDQGMATLAYYCPGLKELNLSRVSQVTDAGIQHIAERCPHLEKLIVPRTGVTDSSISAVARHCASLIHLDVSYLPRVTDDGIVMVATCCPRLQHLGVTSVEDITDISVAAITSNCPRLRCLELSDCRRVTDVTVQVLAGHCRQLEHLNLSSTIVTKAAVLDVTRNCPHLTYLAVSGDAQVDDDVLVVLAGNCPELRHLAVSSARGVTDAGVGAVALRCPRLRHLAVLNCGGVTDASMRFVAENCRELEQLMVMLDYDGVTEASLRLVARNCTRLRSVYLYLWDVGGMPLAAIFDECRVLEHLSLSGLDAPVTDDLMAAISRSCARLRSLEVDCKMFLDEDVASMVSWPAAQRLLSLGLPDHDMITDEALVAVGRACRELRELNASDCVGVTDAGIRAIAVGCPHLESLVVLGCPVSQEALDLFSDRGCDVVS